MDQRLWRPRTLRQSLIRSQTGNPSKSQNKRHIVDRIQSLAKPASPLVCCRQKFYLASRPGFVTEAYRYQGGRKRSEPPTLNSSRKSFSVLSSSVSALTANYYPILQPPTIPHFSSHHFELQTWDLAQRGCIASSETACKPLILVANFSRLSSMTDIAIKDESSKPSTQSVKVRDTVISGGNTPYCRVSFYSIA